MANLQELTQQIERIREEEAASVAEAPDTAALEEVRRKIFGKKGRLSTLMRGMGSIAAEDRPAAGQAANDAKQRLTEAVERREVELRDAEISASVGAEAVDVTLPGLRPALGTLHPLTLTLREIEDVFGAMGFSVELGPDVEDDYHNFEALNFPHDHPARDMHDTFYLDCGLLLRTHTSSVQIHTMSTRKPPMAVVAPGRCYRCDSPDATHSPLFHQVEGFMVGENVRFSDLKGVLQRFIDRMFGEGTPSRLRPSFFPFTEPSAEVDMYSESRGQWIEILGAGMIHANVLENCGIDPEKYTGFAFGMGVERIAMLKYGVAAIGSFFENDARFLRQFR